MYARIATFEGATDLDGAAAEAQRVGPPEGLKATEFYLFGDRAAGRTIFLVLFETEEDMHAGHALLNEMNPGDVGVGHRTSVQLVEVLGHMTV
ncbi:MAG TPA: hypothetical protein VEH55_02465 [Gaiellaceae bacterium]|jgi:hypothetical protein|nr:hypothetical protein [Gaiellaceae bacterium]